MPSSHLEICEILGELGGKAPAGYAIGLHINYTTPKFMFQTYPKSWLDYYSQNGLIMADPMVAWGFENAGTCRWSELEDPQGVMDKAAEFGLKYGLVCSDSSSGGLSIAGFAREDREFDDQEVDSIAQVLGRLHKATAETSALSDETISQLRNMSVLVTHPEG